MNPVNGIGSTTGIWGPAAGRLVQSGATPSLRDVEPTRGLTLGSPEISGAPAPRFADTLSQVLGEVNDLQSRADLMIERLATGKVQNLHEVIVAQQEAAVAFRLIQEVRDKLVSAYQELMRMQV
jgi:flagellar hook-basal body complex protein FliE